MHNDLKCPVCDEVPRPKDIKKYGLCLENGHLTCEYCSVCWIEEAGTKCPVCRAEPFKTKCKHLLADKVLTELCNAFFYKCDYCPKTFQGSSIEDHEILCRAGRYPCPLCNVLVTPQDLFRLRHQCISRRNVYSMEENGWHLKLDFESLFKHDRGILLLHPSRPFRACLQHEVTGVGLYVRVFWVDPNSVATPQTSEVRISMGINTIAGPLFRSKHAKINYTIEGEERHIPINHLEIAMATLTKWDKHASEYVCTRCNMQKPHAHLDLQIVEQ